MIDESVVTYNKSMDGENLTICNLLAELISKEFPNAESKVWHSAPVWFLDGNPIVGYFVRKDSVQLLFWSGQSFDEPGLKPEGKFKAAEARYNSADDINASDVRRWLKKSVDIQWDYKNIVKRRGELLRLK